MAWLIVLIVVIAVVAGIPYAMESRRTLPDAAKAPGRFADLPGGRTHYQWHGSVRGPVAVCVHGLTTPSPVWDGLIPQLHALGYRILTYDLYGRGFSDDAPGSQDAEFFIAQLEELLADQELEGDLTLIGYSMGGTIATAFAEKNAHMLQRMVLIAPAGIEHVEAPFYRFVRQTPIFGDWLHGLIEPLRTRRDLAAEDAAAWPEIHAARRAHLTRAGHFRALLSSRRGILAGDQEDAHRAISREDVPVLAIFGETDEVIPIASMGRLAQWNRTARQEMIEGAGHDLVYAEAERLGDVIREILHEH